MADTTDKTSETTAAGSTATVKEPFYDIAKWATKAPEGEKLISTAYGDKVTEDLRYVKNEPGVHKPDPILVADNVTRRFGGMTAVDVQHFEIERHGITALIGPNGAGKSTLLKSLFGLVHIHSGKLTLKGQDITNLRADKLVSRGVGFVPQTENVFPSLTIAENMHMGAYQAPKLFNERFDYVCSIFPKLGDRRNQLAGQLSGGERQMVAMGRALMMQPSVLLLDEPSAGLSPMMQDETFIRVRQVNRAAVSVVIVEQNARRCLQICDRSGTARAVGMRLVGRCVRRIVEQRGVEQRRHGDRRTAAAHRHPRLPGTAGGGGDQARDRRHQQGGRRARQGRHRGRGRYVGRRACRPEHVSRAVRAVEAPVGRDRTRRIGRRQERLQEHRRREDPGDLNGIDVDDALRHGSVLLPHRRPGCRAGRGDGRPHCAGRREEARHRLLQRRVRHRHAQHHLQKLKDAGVDVVYGEKDAFDPAETNYSSIATAIKNSGADATLIISYDQATPLIKALASAGVDTHKLYLVDGNTVDYSKTYDAGLLKGSKGTIPGTHVDDKFKSDLKGTGTDISDTTYAAETYDAVILAALAAEQGGSTSGETVTKNLSSVSGADGGEKCESFEACKALIKDKKKIQYFGKTGIGPFNKNNDPSSANIGIFEYDGNNVNVFQDMQSGDVPTE